MSPREGLNQPVESRDESQRRASELATLYEVARTLLGARTQAQVAARIVLSGMGALGVRSGAAFVVDERGRYELLFASGIDEAGPGDWIAVPAATREWILREGIFSLFGPAAARGLGPLRDLLVERYDAVCGSAVVDSHGLSGLLLFGPRLLPGGEDEGLFGLLESMTALASQALGAHSARAGPKPEAARSMARRRTTGPARTLDDLRQQCPALRTMVGESESLLETCQDLVAVARTRFPVLLTGESGVGKELAARAIHELSERGEAPFEVADCASIPRELIESELFGHVRGAFTGAHRDRRGAFELAHRGTLFLDEIGEMPLQLQTRLLRVLQESRFRRVGDESLIEVDVRVIAATNRDLRAEVTHRRFREDLYYRLNVFAVPIPPLRERLEDLEPLIRHFMGRQARELDVDDWLIDAEVIQALQRHAWPGNIRELANLCAGLAVRARATEHVTVAELEQVWRRQHPDEHPPWDGDPVAPRGRLGDWVLDHVRAARFNLIEAARLLKRRKRAGQKVPLTERSALSYYLTGEILRALVESDGDPYAATRTLAGDDELMPRVAGRVRKVCDTLRDARGDPSVVRRHFAKLPAGYETLLSRAAALSGGARRSE
jgi:transcriptional regulator with GAF, ATPase, and Fis domain